MGEETIEEARDTSGKATSRWIVEWSKGSSGDIMSGYCREVGNVVR